VRREREGGVPALGVGTFEAGFVIAVFETAFGNHAAGRVLHFASAFFFQRDVKIPAGDGDVLGLLRAPIPFVEAVIPGGGVKRVAIEVVGPGQRVIAEVLFVSERMDFGGGRGRSGPRVLGAGRGDEARGHERNSESEHGRGVYRREGKRGKQKRRRNKTVKQRIARIFAQGFFQRQRRWSAISLVARHQFAPLGIRHWRHCPLALAIFVIKILCACGFELNLES